MSWFSLARIALASLVVACFHPTPAIAEDAKAEQLPRMIVKTVDADAKPVAGVQMLFYDREGMIHRRKPAFKSLNRKTDDEGIAKFGRLPDGFGRLEVRPKGELAGCYGMISLGHKQTRQASPPRANMQVQLKSDLLEVTVTLTPHVDLEFTIVDEETGEIVFWPEIFYQDSETEKWWMIAVVDGSRTQHNFIPISPKIMTETIKIFTAGYDTKTIRFQGDLDYSKSIRHQVRLRPLPQLQLKVVQPGGQPAKSAKIRFDYPAGLDTLNHDDATTDDNGECQMAFPTAAEYGTMRVSHRSGNFTLSLKSLLTDAREARENTLKRVIRLKRFVASQ